MKLRHGVHPILEAEGDRLIKESLKGVTKHSDKSDILTPWKEAERSRREVHVPSGTPDPAHRNGMFHRRLNPAQPHLNSRDGIAQGAIGNPDSQDIDSLRGFVAGSSVMRDAMGGDYRGKSGRLGSDD
jgi:hypothetical protein